MTKKNILFFSLLVLFLATSIITLLGITKVIPIEEKYLVALCAAFLVELAAAVYGWSKNGNLLEDSSSHPLSEGKFKNSILKLQFFGDKRVPHEELSQNIASWFTYFTPSISLQIPGDSSGGIEVPPNWVIFLVFDQPIQYRQAVFEFSNPNICPIIDIHAPNNRMVALSTRGPMPAGILAIKVIE